MSPSYTNRKEICFPNVRLIIDKFHVKQNMLLAMDEVRREKQGKIVSKKRNSCKKLLMTSQTRQTEQPQEAVLALSKKYPKTGRAYRMVQCIDEMYKCNHPEEAETVFKRLVNYL